MRRRARSRWLVAVVAGGAVVGGASSLISSPAPSAASATPTVSATSGDATTNQIRSLTNESRRLGTDILHARDNLTRLEQRVAWATEQRRAAELSAQQRAATARSSAVTLVSTAPLTHAKTGASSALASDDGTVGGVSSDN